MKSRCWQFVPAPALWQKTTNFEGRLKAMSENRTGTDVNSVKDRPAATLQAKTVDEVQKLVLDERVAPLPSTAHLTLPSIPQEQGVKGTGEVTDPARVRAALLERAARLHPNPPDDMEVEPGVTVGMLHRMHTGEGQTDIRRVALVDENSPDHPAQPNVLSGATTFATTVFDPEEADKTVEQPAELRQATGDMDMRAAFEQAMARATASQKTPADQTPVGKKSEGGKQSDTDKQV